MNDVPALFGADAVLSKALERFYELRPSAFRHCNLRGGVYYHPFAAFRAVIAVLCERITQLVRANRLTTAEGEDLVAYVLAKYDELPDLSDTAAVGYCTIGLVDPALTTQAGTLAKGSRFSMPSFTLHGVVHPSATFETTEDVAWASGLTQPNSSKRVKCKAAATGTAGNTSQWNGRTNATGSSIDGAFDSRLKATSVVTAGGGGKPSDPVIRRFARSIVTGQYGPTAGAAVYGALRTAGVKHVVDYDDTAAAALKLVVADESWGGGATQALPNESTWASVVKQAVYDADVVGFGCKVTVAGVQNVFVGVNVTVALRDRNFLSNPDEITEAIRKSVRSYFDDRDEWNTWTSRGLRAAIMNASPKIFNCGVPTVTVVGGGAVSESTSGSSPYHYDLARDAVVVTYTGPV